MRNISDRPAYQVWDTLSAGEKKTFIAAWAGSPGAKTLLTAWEDFEDPRALWIHCFPDRAFSDSGWRTWLSEIKKEIEQFIARIELETESVVSQMLLIQHLKHRAAPELLRKYVDKLEGQLLAAKRRDAPYFQNLYDFYVLKQEICLTKWNERVSYLAQRFQYKRQAEFLTHMDLVLQLVNEQQVYAHTTQERLKETEAVTHIRKTPEYEQNPLLQIYVLFYDLLMGKLVDVKQLESLVVDSVELADHATFANFFRLLFNESVNRTTTDSSILTLESICFFVPKGISLNFFSTDAYLPLSIFLTLIRAASFTQSAGVVERWIEQFGAQLNESEQGFARSYARAFAAYPRGEYQFVIDLEPHIVRKNLAPKLFLNFKFLVLECFLLMDDIDQAEKRTRNIELWIKRNKEEIKGKESEVKKRLVALKKYIFALGSAAEPSVRAEIQSSDLPYAHRYVFQQHRAAQA